MKTLAFLIDVICTFHEAFWLYYMIDAVFERRKPGNNKWLLLGICIGIEMVLVLALNQIVLTSPYTAMAAMLETMLATCIFWKSDFIKAFIIPSVYLSVLMIVATIEISLTGMIGGDELIYQTTMEQNGIRAFYLLICGLIWFCINWFLYKWIQKIEEENIKYIFWLSVIGWMGGCFFAGQMVIGFEHQINIMAYVFLMAFLACIYGVYFMVKKKEIQMRLQMTSAQNDMLEQNYERMNEFYKANAKLYHDLNHHLSAIYHMLEKGNQEQAKQYIESLREPLNLPPVPIRTSLDMVDVILYEMDKKAERKGVLMIVDAQRMPSDITIEKKDLCALFANLLDNAVEAAGREIRMQIRPIHQMLFIQIENDFVTEPVKQNGRFRTTKKNPDSHGWGMQIIEQIVSKYEGSIEYEVKEGSFCVNAMINMFM